MFIETLRNTIYAPVQTVKAVLDKTSQFAADFFNRLSIPHVTSSQAKIYAFVAIAMLLQVSSAKNYELKQAVTSSNTCCGRGFMSYAIHSVCWYLNHWKSGNPYPNEIVYSASELSPSNLAEYSAYCGDCRVQLLDFVILGSNNFWSYINQNITNATTPPPLLGFRITDCTFLPDALKLHMKNFTISFL